MYLLIHAPLWKISFLPLGINYQTVLSLALCSYDETFVVILLVIFLLIHALLFKISFLPLGINYQTVLSLALCPYDETFVVNLLVNILCFPKEKPENKSYYYSGKTSLGTVNRLFQNYI